MKEQTDFEIKLIETVKKKVDYSRYLRPEDFLDAKDLTVLKYDIKHKLQYRDELALFASRRFFRR